MKTPKVSVTYCPRCNKHTEHAIALYKKGKDRVQAEGARRYSRKQKGYGGQKKPKQRKTAKTTKKQSLKLKCKVCGYTIQRAGTRAKKIEIKA